MIRHFAAALFWAATQQSFALTELSDESMSAVTGRDGITVAIQTPASGWSADSIEWRNDVGGFGGDPGFEAALQFGGASDSVTAKSVDLTGSTVGGTPVSITQTLDIGSDGADPLIQYSIGLDRVRLQTGSLTVSSQPAVSDRSFGKWALDAPMAMTIRNRGLFDDSYSKAYVKGEVGFAGDYANFFYRQAGGDHSYMTMHDFHAMWEMTEGTLGVDSEGIVWRTGYGGDWASIPGNRSLSESDLINIALDFEYLYKDPGVQSETQEFVITSKDRGLMHFGWLGSVKDVEIHWRGGGTWYGDTGGNGIYNVNNKSGGLNFGGGWDFVSRADATSLADAGKEFRWRLGETSDVCPNGSCASGQDQSRVNFELGDWIMWGERTSGSLHSKPSAFYFPLIALDTINGAGQGAGGLCWGYAYNSMATTCSGGGGQFINVQPGSIGPAYGAGLTHLNADGGTAGALAIYVRDAQLQAYSRSVKLLERSSNGSSTTETSFDWGLIYALANLDATIYLYPGGSSYDESTGIIADITVMSQTLDETDVDHQGFNWEHGSHLLIADTHLDDGVAKGSTRDAMGIGFLSSSFLLAANDTRIMLKDQTGASNYYSGGLDFLTPAARFHYKATFGGGVLPDDTGSYGNGPRIVQGLLLDANLEGAANVRFSASTPGNTGTWGASQYAGPYEDSKNYLGYSAAFRLGSLGASQEGIGGDAGSSYGSYLLLAEPGRPDVAWRFANINGDIAFTNGLIDLRGTNEDGDATPKLVIANNMLIGEAASARVTEGFSGVDLSGQTYGGTSGHELTSNMMLGNNVVGTAVIPSASVYSSITLTPQ